MRVCPSNASEVRASTSNAVYKSKHVAGLFLHHHIAPTHSFTFLSHHCLHTALYFGSTSKPFRSHAVISLPTRPNWWAVSILLTSAFSVVVYVSTSNRPLSRCFEHFIHFHQDYIDCNISNYISSSCQVSRAFPCQIHKSLCLLLCLER
jgi:hypothetical protein